MAFGEDTTFGAYSSANGKRYDNGYTDVASGDSFGRTGVAKPVPGTGDGGAGGKGGTKGQGHYETSYNSQGNPNGTYWAVDVPPGKGANGAKGVFGCVVVYWDKEGA